jgi:hypothetical protein
MENNFKHTKGEWFFEEKINSEGNISINMFSAKGGLLTKLIDDDSKTFDEIKANAILMKNAPKMLEAIIEFCKRVDNGEVRSKKTYSKFKKLIEEIES